MKLVLATHNPGKIREIGETLKKMNSHVAALKDRNEIQVLSLLNYPEAPAVDEDGRTYEENAIKKASAIAQYTRELALADDSGLEVDALYGAPGIHSARYAGENTSDAERIEKLLNALQEVTDNQRTARFKCAVAIAKPEAQTLVKRRLKDPNNPDLQPEFESPVKRAPDLSGRLREIPCSKVFVGVCEGQIILTPRGDQGFGYDPIFVPAGYDKTFAELGEEIKNQISHRAKALAVAMDLLFNDSCTSSVDYQTEFRGETHGG